MGHLRPRSDLPRTLLRSGRGPVDLHEIWIYGGASEIMKTVIAREVTGLRGITSRSKLGIKEDA
jgi:hypothetical protein